MSAVLTLLSSAAAFATDVEVTGLFNNKAMVSINRGNPRVMSAGQTSPEGVKLISADSTGAIFEVDGEKKKIGMGQSISTNYASGSKPTVKLTAGPGGHFTTGGSINGVPVNFMVDTGATMVSISTRTAQRMGVDLKTAQAGMTTTANGTAVAYKVTLTNVKVGAISLNLVEALVSDGMSDSFALLGNSFLSRLDMKREGEILTLTQNY
jgi:aspartyl protease family protein